MQERQPFSLVPQDFEAVYAYINSFPKSPREREWDVIDTARTVDTARSVTVHDWLGRRPGAALEPVVEPLPVVADDEDRRRLNGQWTNIVAAGRLMGAFFKAVAPLPFDLMAGKDAGSGSEVKEALQVSRLAPACLAMF